MLPLRELDLENDADFGTLKTCIDALYSELVSPSAVPDAEMWARIREQVAAGATPRRWAFVARDGASAPLAFVMLGESFAVFARGRYGIITELWVRPDARSAGVGAQVIEFVRAFGAQQGWRRLDVSAPPDAKWDRTVAFYRKQGFEIAGRKLKYRLPAS